VTIEVIESVPDDWDEEDVNFYKNESSSCANNTGRTIARVLSRADGSDVPCLCDRIKVQYLRDATVADVERDGLDPNLASSVAG
jgi:hypothetical protein